MGWFGRDRESRKGRETEGALEGRHPGADEALPFFTEDEAARFRSLVRTTFAELGMEVVVRADHMETDDGHQYGLWNLAASCHNDERGERAWPAVIDRHVRLITTATRSDALAELSDEGLMASVHVRLVEAASVDSLGRDGFDYAFEVAPGVLRLLVVDLPETVMTPPQSQLEKRAPLARLLDQGWRNLQSLPDREEFEAQQVEHEGASFTVLLGESLLTASLALILPDVVARYAPGATMEHGAFVCMPYRHQLAFHVIDDPQVALQTLMVMPQFAIHGFSDGAGPLSPHTYWWRDGELHQLTAIDEDGRLALTRARGLQALLGITND